MARNNWTNKFCFLSLSLFWRGINESVFSNLEKTRTFRDIYKICNFLKFTIPEFTCLFIYAHIFPIGKITFVHQHKIPYLSAPVGNMSCVYILTQIVHEKGFRNAGGGAIVSCQHSEIKYQKSFPLKPKLNHIDKNYFSCPMIFEAMEMVSCLCCFLCNIVASKP